MLAKISSGKSVYGVLAYNKIKVDDNQADVLYSQKMFDSMDGKFSIRNCMDSFYPYLVKNNKTENVVFHASLNSDPKDKLSDEQLSTVVQRYMEKLGYGNQPYIVIKHFDINRTHAHIISLRIDETGKKINDSYEVARSMKICKELEQEFNLIPLKKGQRESEAPTKKIDYKAGDLKHQVGNITKSVMANYHFQSFGEYRTLLEQFNVTVDEVKGEYKGRPYRGLIYSVLDENGEKVSKPFKSSLFGKSVNTEALQKHFEKSKIVIDKSGTKDRLKPIISRAMNQPNINIDSFRQSLLKQGIGCIFRQNEQGRIYGITFIDYQNRTILNGSRLGKVFSANIFNGLFKDSSERNIEPTADNKTSIEKNRSGQFTESSGVPQSTESDSSSLGIGLFEQHGTDYDAENFVREKENEEKSRKRKKKRKSRGL
ncbi:conjugal transfer protein MobB [Dysgonomonas sp. 511]|uniref:conjugal transfer protein MobB n=1 Tax=Dysgonomonas sp. 511 TaxID=2302930 RepID=UPI0013D59607|nr:conjugal transfer protein MobB [Dysgonomonas sp. 511]NDV79427.1 mobilization protein [Dysgonomonas sp. 511]